MNRLLSLVGIAALLLVCGCSSFNRDWKRATPIPPPDNSIEGRWEGRWLSEANGHTGRLRCLLTRQDDKTFSARFRATYWKIFRFTYAVDFAFEQQGEMWHFQGNENLGWLAGGVYKYAGQVSSTNFSSTYWSKYDHGTFEMRRP